MHAGSPAVARCDGCGRRLCLACAVPVRGHIFGPECLARALGTEAGTDKAPQAVPEARVGSLVRGVALAVAWAATLLPWSRFGEGAGWFGAWGRSRWSLLAAVASAAGLLLWLIARRMPSLRGRGWELALGLLGLLTAVGGVMAAVHPPFASRAWFAPWIAAGAGLAVVATSLAPERGPRRDAGI